MEEFPGSETGTAATMSIEENMAIAARRGERQRSLDGALRKKSGSAIKKPERT